jgi:putative FmdB family regulatory protein
MVQSVTAQMPIYAYKCSSCGHTKDALQKFSDAPLTVCPACGNATFAKQLTAPGFQLKGSGWYVTDFRDGKKPSGDAKTDAPATDAKTDTKTDTKTETKTDAKTETAATPAASPSTTPAPAPSTPAPAAAAPAK